jgi:hypothetical protein
VTTVDGEAVNPGDDANAVDAVRLELKLCRALAAMKPAA